MNGLESDDGGRTALGAVSVLVVLCAFALTAGVPGVLFGAAFAAAWYRLPATYAVGLGHFALVALAVDGAGILATLAAETGLLATLVAPAVGTERLTTVATATIAGALTLSALAWAGTALWDDVWPTALLLASGIALAAYATHRYEQFALASPEEST